MTVRGGVRKLPRLRYRSPIADRVPACLGSQKVQRGRFYWFMTACECGTAYLIHTENDGEHAKAADTPECIEAQ
jgi:hypothetical protein